jgi:hypothetical protein
MSERLCQRVEVGQFKRNGPHRQPFVIGSATELIEPLPKLGALGLLAVFDDLFGCPAGGFSGALLYRCPPGCPGKCSSSS